MKNDKKTNSRRRRKIKVYIDSLKLGEIQKNET